MNEENTHDPLLGRFLLNQYKIIRKLGQGGFGAVYEAFQPSLDRKVAVKVMHLDLTRSPEAITRFRREGLIATKLKHPCTVEVFTLGQTDEGHLWLAMEFVEGQTLEQYLRQHKTLTPQDIFDILAPVLDVLAEAHEKGIVHRDLKPDNIMLSIVEGRRMPKVLDFGISSLQGADSATHAAMVSGTPQYMAPEQWEGMAMVDARSDLYSMGVILYRALSSRLPFQADTPLAWMKKHHMEEPLDLAIAVGNQSLSPALHQVVMRAISKDPIHRQQSALQLKEELQTAISASPVVSPIVTEVIKPPSKQHAHLDSSGDSLASITRSETGDLYAVGEYGVIVESSDGGEYWGLVESQTEMALNCVWAGSRLICAVGELGTITCSKEGTHWETRPNKSKASLRAVWGNSKKVFVAGQFGTVLISEDNGESFQPIQVGTRETICAIWGCEPPSVIPVQAEGATLESRSGLNKPGSWTPASSAGETDVEGAGETDVLKPSVFPVRSPKGEDTGIQDPRPSAVRSWTPASSAGETDVEGAGETDVLPKGRLSSASVSATLESSRELDGGVVYLGGTNATLLRSMDNGGTWQRVALPELPGRTTIMSIDGRSAHEIYLVTTDGLMVHTTDGETFFVTKLWDGMLRQIRCLADGKLAAITDSGDFCTSLDSIHHWRGGPVEGYLMRSMLVEEGRLLFVGKGNSIVRYQDEVFEEIFRGTFPHLSSCHQEAEELFLCGTNGAFVYSSDGGRSWYPTQRAGLPAINCIHRPHGGRYFFTAGLKGHLSVFERGGQSWDLKMPTPADIYCVWSSAPDDVYVIGEHGKIHHTADEGGSWEERESGVAISLVSMWGNGPDELYIVGLNGLILRSTDRGYTWEKRESGTHEDLHCIFGFASGDIFIVGDKGTLLYSNNLGLSWQKRFSTTKEHLSSIHGEGLDDLFICGTGGTLLHSRDKGWTWQAWPTNTKIRLVEARRMKTSVIAFGYHGVLLYFDTMLEEDETNQLDDTMGKTLVS